MKANPYSLQNILGEKQQWVVPVYQRHYEWETGEDKQLSHLWNDLLDKAEEVADGRPVFPHYFGAVICSEPKVVKFGATPQRFLIDGQQRLTTFNILVAALRECARERSLSSIETALRSYLFNETSASMIDPEREEYKLWPSSYDRELFRLIITLRLEGLRTKVPDYFYKKGTLKGNAPRLLSAYCDLLSRIERYLDDVAEVGVTAEKGLQYLIEGFLQGFQIVLIELGDGDDAQEIFASLNGLGKPLAPFDLIRNDVFLRSKKLNEDSEALFQGKWRTFEEPFWMEQVRQGRLKRARADHLIAHCVIAETGREVSVAKIATEYQRYAREAKFTSVAEELEKLLCHARTYRLLEERPIKAITSPLAAVMDYWDTAVFHPVIFCINASVEEDSVKVAMLNLIEAYLVRREICGLTAKNYNKVILSWIRAIKGSSDPLGNFKSVMMAGGGDISRCPNDVELVEAFCARPAYERIPFRRLFYILSQLENASRDKLDEVKMVAGDLSIEHIMPQQWMQNWPLPNGERLPRNYSYYGTASGLVSDETKALERVRAGLIDTFGNLTLLTRSANPSLGNREWEHKRSLFAESLLALNRKVGSNDVWDEDRIRARSKLLGELATKAWRTA